MSYEMNEFLKTGNMILSSNEGSVTKSGYDMIVKLNNNRKVLEEIKKLYNVGDSTSSKSDTTSNNAISMENIKNKISSTLTDISKKVRIEGISMAKNTVCQNGADPSVVGKLFNELLHISSVNVNEEQLKDACGALTATTYDDDTKKYIVKCIDAVINMLNKLGTIEGKTEFILTKDIWEPLYDLLSEKKANGNTYFATIIFDATKKGSPEAKSMMDKLKNAPYGIKAGLNTFNTTVFGWYKKLNFFDEAINTFNKLEKPAGGKRKTRRKNKKKVKRKTRRMNKNKVKRKTNKKLKIKKSRKQRK